MSAGIAVRRAQFDDLPVIVELRLALLREYADNPLYATLRPDAADRALALFRTQLASTTEVMFVAERNGTVVGLLRCVDSLSSPLLLPDRYCYVSSVYVRPAERRRGVLRALMTAAEQWCAERGLAEMRLHNGQGASLAEAAWDAIGFEVVEQVRRRTIPVSRAAGVVEHAAEAN